MKQPARHDFRLVPAAAGAWGICAWATVVSARHVALVAAVFAGLFLLVGVAYFALHKRLPMTARAVRRPVLIAVLTGGILASVLGITAVHQSGWQASLLFEAREAQGRSVLVVTVTSDVKALKTQGAVSWSGPRWRADASVEAVTYRGKYREESARITLIGGEDLRGVSAGQKVIVQGAVRATDPGDASRAVIFLDDEIALEGEPSGLYAWGGAARKEFRQAADGLPGAASGLVPGMVVGDTSGVDDEIDAAMRDTSLTHLTAVSGAHCTLIIGAALALTRPPQRWPRQKRAALRVGIAALTLIGFVIVTGPQPSVLRASIMGVVGLLGLLRGRKSRALAALACAVITLLTIDPWLARNLGFCLSVASTAAIVTAAGPLAQWLVRWRIRRALALGLAVSASAQVACLPFLLLIDPRLTVYALIANVAATPIFPFVSLPGALALLVSVVIPPATPLILWVAALPANVIAFIATTISSLPGATVSWPPPPGFWWIVVIGCAVGAVTWLRRAWVRRNAGYMASLCGVVVVVVVVGAAGPGEGLRRYIGIGGVGEAWFAVQCDVGQGDALVIRASSGATVMIDVGLPGDLAAACLRDLGVKRIELLVLTHWHLDHVGGLEGVLNQVDIDQIWVPAWDEPTLTAAPAQRLISNVGVASTPATAGMMVELEGLTGRALWPTQRALDLMPDGADDGTSVNDLSTVMAFDVETVGRRASIVALGDVEEAGQRGLIREIDFGAVTVVKMAHHGSRRQSEQLAKILEPRVVLIGVGEDNDYGHPSDSAWQIYERAGALIGSTDRDGQVRVVHDSTQSLKMLVNTGSSR